jgi:hypothetical protein
MSELPNLLTEAQNRSGVVFVVTDAHKTDTNARTVPYTERYAGYSGLYQTPLQRLQEAASVPAAKDAS